MFSTKGIKMTTQPDPLQRESFRCTADEKREGIKEAEKRGMTFSQFVRLMVRLGVAQGTGRIQ